MTVEMLNAIEKVITINGDIMTLLEKRGCSYEDIKEVFRLARMAVEKDETPLQKEGFRQ